MYVGMYICVCRCMYVYTHVKTRVCTLCRFWHALVNTQSASVVLCTRTLYLVRGTMYVPYTRT